MNNPNTPPRQPYGFPQPYPVTYMGQICVAHNVFTPEQMDQIEFLEDLQVFQNGGVGNKNNPAQAAVSEKEALEYRNSKVSFIYADQTSAPIFHRFTEVLLQVNLEHFRRDIQGFDAMQYTIYEEGGQYNWHWDVEMMNTKFIRKISASIMVSSPDEYEGGELEIINRGSLDKDKIFSSKPNRGDVVFFGSWMPHRVKPVTKGKRKSLVVWVVGEDHG